MAYSEKTGKFPSNQVEVGKCGPLHKGTTKEGKKLPPDVQETINKTENDPRRINAARDSVKAWTAMGFSRITPQDAARRDVSNEVIAHKVWMEHIQEKTQSLQQQTDNGEKREQK